MPDTGDTTSRGPAGRCGCSSMHRKEKSMPVGVMTGASGTEAARVMSKRHNLGKGPQAPTLRHAQESTWCCAFVRAAFSWCSCCDMAALSASAAWRALHSHATCSSRTAFAACHRQLALCTSWGELQIQCISCPLHSRVGLLGMKLINLLRGSWWVHRHAYLAAHSKPSGCMTTRPDSLNLSMTTLKR